MNDWVGISTAASPNDTFLCHNIDDFSILVSSSEVDISFSARRDRHAHGFSASYVSVPAGVTGKRLHLIGHSL